jgi:hypothetical protein
MIKEWTHADQVRKVKHFLRSEIAHAKSIREGRIIVPFTSYEQAVHKGMNSVADLRAALLELVLRGDIP